MRRVLYFALAFVIVASAGVLYVRTAPSDPSDWHIDPMAAERTGRPNDFMVRPPGFFGADMESRIYPLAIGTLSRALDAVAASEPRVNRLAGNPDQGFITYVARSRLVGFPDYVSVRVVPSGDGVAFAIWSRARFGYSDRGVNKARVERWISGAEQRLGL